MLPWEFLCTIFGNIFSFCWGYLQVVSTFGVNFVGSSILSTHHGIGCRSNSKIMVSLAKFASIWQAYWKHLRNSNSTLWGRFSCLYFFKDLFLLERHFYIEQRRDREVLHQLAHSADGYNDPSWADLIPGDSSQPTHEVAGAHGPRLSTTAFPDNKQGEH